MRVGAAVGQGTNNEAEYQALLGGLRHALKLGLWNLRVISDSLLVVNQFAGTWKARDGRLRRLRDEAANLGRLFPELTMKHTHREGNAAADELSHLDVFEEPQLPLLAQDTPSRFQRGLYPWQAAAIRIWWLRHHPGAYTLARVFGVSSSTIEAIGYGTTYRNADFSGYEEYLFQIGVTHDQV